MLTATEGGYGKPFLYIGKEINIITNKLFDIDNNIDENDTH
jgi:hypothetical protein